MAPVSSADIPPGDRAKPEGRAGADRPGGDVRDLGPASTLQPVGRAGRVPDHRSSEDDRSESRRDRSQEAAEGDRSSFMRFLGLGLADGVPDYSTIRRFGVPPPSAREALVTAGAMDNRFVRFDAALTDRGIPGARRSVARRLHRRGFQAAADGRGEAACPCWRATRPGGRQGSAHGHRSRPRRSADRRPFGNRIIRLLTDDGP